LLESFSASTCMTISHVILNMGPCENCFERLAWMCLCNCVGMRDRESEREREKESRSIVLYEKNTNTNIQNCQSLFQLLQALRSLSSTCFLAIHYLAVTPRKFKHLNCMQHNKILLIYLVIHSFNAYT